MNWKLLLVVATLSLTTTLTACGKKADDAAAPDATKPAETSTPVDAVKDGAAKTGDAMKNGAAKTGDAVKGAGDAVKGGAGDAMKGAGDAMKGAGDAMKGDKPATGTKSADAPKKP